MRNQLVFSLLPEVMSYIARKIYNCVSLNSEWNQPQLFGSQNDRDQTWFDKDWSCVEADFPEVLCPGVKCVWTDCWMMVLQKADRSGKDHREHSQPHLLFGGVFDLLELGPRLQRADGPRFPVVTWVRSDCAGSRENKAIKLMKNPLFKRMEYSLKWCLSVSPRDEPEPNRWPSANRAQCDTA